MDSLNPNVVAERSEDRKNQLREIMCDAVKSVRDRPDTRRGPYLISDSDLDSLDFTRIR